MCLLVCTDISLETQTQKKQTQFECLGDGVWSSKVPLISRDQLTLLSLSIPDTYSHSRNNEKQATAPACMSGGPEYALLTNCEVWIQTPYTLIL